MGAPADFHTRATELPFVISGSQRVLVGEEVTVLHAGGFLAIPPHTPHAFAASCERFDNHDARQPRPARRPGRPGGSARALGGQPRSRWASTSA